MASVSFITVLTHVNQLLPNLWKLVTAATYLGGIYFAVLALFHLKDYGEKSMYKTPSADIRKPLTSMLVAVVLLYWPSLLHAFMMTTFGTEYPLAYPHTGLTDKYNMMLHIGGNIIQFIGFIAFIRGWVLLTRIAQQGAQPGAFGKSMSHIFGGLFAINIFGTWKVMASLFGIT